MFITKPAQSSDIYDIYELLEKHRGYRYNVLAFFRCMSHILGGAAMKSEITLLKNRFAATAFLAALFISGAGLLQQASAFDFSRYLFGEPSTLSTTVVEINPSTGYVLMNGCDTQQPSNPFTWDWGDGTVYDGWFPQSHTYSGVTENYVVKTIAHYPGGATDTAETVVRFVAPDIDPIALPPEVGVTVPDAAVTLGTRLYDPPQGLTWFDDGFFDIVPRSTVEYVLSVASHIQKNFVNDDVYLFNGGFEQVVLRDPSFGGMYSLWFTDPVSFASGDYGFQGMIGWSSFMHEMGHNYTLNSPADYYYGGSIDGNANAIYSESMAQIFQHATAYEIINHGANYGLSEDLVADVRASAVSSIRFVRDSYEDYLNTGMNFASWNDPGTEWDETFNTFMTVAYKFFAHAETSGLEYRLPLKRMMQLLQIFDEDLRQRYDQYNNTAEADTFRATLMVAAVSRAFFSDLRSEFRDLNFPVSDATYDELMGILAGVEEGPPTHASGLRLLQNHPNPFNPMTTIVFTLPESMHVRLSVFDVGGTAIKTLLDGPMAGGFREVSWDGTDAHGNRVGSGIYFYRLTAGAKTISRKMVILR
jgi:hypothetical protein